MPVSAKAPSDEGAVSFADWGRDTNMCNQKIFSPSVAYGDSSLVRGSLGRCRARWFFDT